MATTTAVLAISAAIQYNRGGHPYVEISEDAPAFAILRATAGTHANGSLSSALTFTTPVAVTVNGSPHVVTGVGAIYREETVTRERNPRNGKIRETITKGPAQCYAYLDESPVARRTAHASGSHGWSEESGQEQWEQHSGAPRRADGPDDY